MRFCLKVFTILVILMLLSGQPVNDQGNRQTHRSSVSAQSLPNTFYLPLIVNPGWNIFGITMDRITPASGFDRAIEARATWTRRELHWFNVEPVENQRNWNAVVDFENELIDASQKMVRVIGIIGGTPNWAVYPGVTCHGKVRADKFAALAKFAADVVKRYSAPPYNVLYWELWNEPDVVGLLGCWGDGIDTQSYGGSYYGQMLKVVYPAMKAANPMVNVLVGGLLLDCDPVNPPPGIEPSKISSSRFFEGILKSGAGNSFDGVSFHAYDYYGGSLGAYFNPNWNGTGPVELVKAAYLRGLLNQYGVGGKFLMNTEVGLLFDNPTSNDTYETTKAYYIPQAYSAAIADGYVANIWYSMFGDRNSGLINPDLSPRPAFRSFEMATRWLASTSYSAAVSQFTNVRGYEFRRTRNSNRVWLLWSANGSDQPITLPAVPLLISRVAADGSEEVVSPSGQSLTVGIAPVYVEMTP